MHISVLNGALWDVEQVHYGICEIGPFATHPFLIVFERKFQSRQRAVNAMECVVLLLIILFIENHIQLLIASHIVHQFDHEVR